jgi:hypothetical protein
MIADVAICDVLGYFAPNVYVLIEASNRRDFVAVVRGFGKNR